MKLRDLFYINRSDRNSIIVLIIIVAAALSLIIFFDDRSRNSEDLEETSDADTYKGGNYQGHNSDKYKSYNYNTARTDNLPIGCPDERKIILQKFDPNTADSTLLLGLGLSRWQVRNIYKYRAHGGIYRKKTDFARIYGLTVKQYRTIEPYIVISDDYKEASTLLSNEEKERDTIKYPQKIKEGEFVFLNSSDTAQLKKVPGIGSAFARAIINYGERLGGYVDIAQLMEINGFPEESLLYFNITPTKTKKININRMSVSAMSRHPYISFFMAKKISDYRRLNGPIKDLSALKLDKDFTAEAIDKLRPYIEY